MIISNVGQVIAERQFASIGPDNTVRDACQIMCELDVGAVVVTDGETLVGVLSERDVMRRCICAGRHTAETRVADIMTGAPKTVSTDASMVEALEVMSDAGFHHVPVMQAGKAVGMISANDIPGECRMLLEQFRGFQGQAGS